MKKFPLQIITPDGKVFDGDALSVVARTTNGDVCILASHTNYVASIDYGYVKIKTEKEEKTASCIGGYLTVDSGEVTIIATTFEYADEIDAERAKKAKEKAERIIDSNADELAIKIAKLKLKRALNRLSVIDRVK